MRQCFLALVAVGAVVSPAQAQRPPSQSSRPPGSSVQLPTFSTFTTSTSVSVPDSGGALLGGVRQAAAGRGGETNRIAQAGVTAQIHDMAAMEKEILERAAAIAPPARVTRAFAAPRGQVSSAERPAMSVAQSRRLREAEAESTRGEAFVWVERARAAEEQGKSGAARIYYQMAARRADGELRQEILARIEALRRR